MKGKIGLITLLVVMLLPGVALAQGKAALWDGKQWPQMTYDAKVGYVSGIGNLADFETAAGKGKYAAVSKVLATELRNKTVAQIIDQVDDFYKTNPDKLNTTVLEVVLQRCTTACPPGMAGVKK